MKKVRLKRHKIIIKQRLANKVVSFSEEELQKIIDDEFFTDGIEMDIEIIDMAARRMAALTGNSECEQIEKIAHAALRRALKNSIKKPCRSFMTCRATHCHSGKPRSIS